MTTIANDLEEGTGPNVPPSPAHIIAFLWSGDVGNAGANQPSDLDFDLAESA